MRPAFSLIGAHDVDKLFARSITDAVFWDQNRVVAGSGLLLAGLLEKRHAHAHIRQHAFVALQQPYPHPDCGAVAVRGGDDRDHLGGIGVVGIGVQRSFHGLTGINAVDV